MEAERLEKRYTVADYMTWEGDWELWDGIPVQLYPPHPEEMSGFKEGVQMSPSPIGPHQIVALNIGRLIANALEASDSCNCSVANELDWQVSDTCVVRPDVSVICPKLAERYIDQPPRLIAEVLSPSTVKRDLEWKRSLYEKQGVDWYLLTDVGPRDVRLMKNVEGRFIPTRLEELTLHEGCEIQLDTERFWFGL
jgi:Uma2 family endonuclease